MASSEVFKTIKALGWSAISLRKNRYRGAIQLYKSKFNEIGRVAVYFYLDECFIIEDKDGLFHVEDLKDFFMKKNGLGGDVDLEATGYIEGLSLIAFINEDGSVGFADETLNRLGINDEIIREDIEKRLRTVNILSEMEDVDMGFDEM